MLVAHIDNITYVGSVSHGHDDRFTSAHDTAREIFARDKKVTPNAAQHWLWRNNGSGNNWRRFSESTVEPGWIKTCDYRYDPYDAKFINETTTLINKPYWCINTCAPDLLHEGIWLDLPEQLEWHKANLVFWDKRQAIHAVTALKKFIEAHPK